MPNVLIDFPEPGYILCKGIKVVKDATTTDQGGTLSVEGKATAGEIAATSLDDGDGHTIYFSGAEWTTEQSVNAEQYTGSGSSLTHIQVPKYANDDAAKSGGLVAGDCYAVTCTGVVMRVADA
jgi:hypothetical protein